MRGSCLRAHVHRWRERKGLSAAEGRALPSSSSLWETAPRVGRGCGCRKVDRLVQGAVSGAEAWTEACANVHVAKAQGSGGCGCTSSLFEECCPMSEQRQALAG